MLQMRASLCARPVQIQPPVSNVSDSKTIQIETRIEIPAEDSSDDSRQAVGARRSLRQ
jgi:hypothetical protein